MGTFEKKIESGKGSFLSKKMPFAYTEAFKTLRTNLSFASVSKQYKRIVLTSSISEEGKSTVSLNLAQTLGESGSKVLLIDSDLRNPSLHKLLRIRGLSSNGLTALLTGEAQISECVQTNSNLHFDYLVAGAVPPNPAELLGSYRMKELLDIFSQQYDYIICDAPPVGLVTDATVLSRFCDGVLLVVRQSFATRDQVRAAKTNLEIGNANIIGTIMTHYDLSKAGPSQGYTYRYDYVYSYESRGPRKTKKKKTPPKSNSPVSKE